MSPILSNQVISGVSPVLSSIHATKSAIPLSIIALLPKLKCFPLADTCLEIVMYFCVAARPFAASIIRTEKFRLYSAKFDC